MADRCAHCRALLGDTRHWYEGNFYHPTCSPLTNVAALQARIADLERQLAEANKRYAYEGHAKMVVLEQLSVAKAEVSRLTEALQKAEADAARMREALREAAAALDQAREDVACWGSYAGEYFQDKHDLEGDLDRLAKQASAARRALEGDTND